MKTAKCAVCGKRRKCSFYVRHGSTLITANQPVGTSGGTVVPEFYGWRCREHHPSATSSTTEADR